MEYIKNNGITTKRFEVIINKEKLKNIISELDERCFHIVHKTIKVTAYNRVEARFKLQTKTNSTDTNICEIIDVSDGYKGLVNNDDSLYTFDCEVLAKEKSKLSDILNKLIVNYNSKVNFKKENNRLVDLLYNYPSSDEVKSYDTKLFELDQMANEFDNVDELKIKKDEVLEDKKNNPHFNPVYLLYLYGEAMSCINFVLLEEIKHDYYESKGIKVYKIKRK